MTIHGPLTTREADELARILPPRYALLPDPGRNEVRVVEVSPITDRERPLEVN